MADLKKPSVKSKVEAVLFSVGHKISLDEISKLCRSRKEDVLQSLQELQKEYDEKQSSLMLAEDGDFWKFTVRDHLISVVRKIVTETEMSKSVMETLAVIAFKYPILQAELIKIRTNKAYDHLAELEKAGYITRQKHSRTNLIKLTEKFFKYFDLTEEKLHEQFRDFDSIAKAIKEKEEEVDKIKDDQRKKAEDLKQEDEKIRKEIESLDKSDEEFSIPLDTYKTKPQENTVQSDADKSESEIKENIGDLEVVEVKEHPREAPKPNLPQPSAEKITQEKPHHDKKSGEAKKEMPEQKQENTGGQENDETALRTETAQIDKTQVKKPKNKGKRIKLSPEMEKKVDERVDEIIHGEKSNSEENNES